MYTTSKTPIATMITLDRDQCIGRIIRSETHFGLDQIKQARQFVLSQSKNWIPYHFIDVGANIGTHIIAALLGVGFSEATAFEPVAELFKVLTENIRINNLTKQSRLINVALSRNRATLQMELSPHNLGDNRIIKSRRLSKHNEELWEKATILTVTLDSITEIKNNQLTFLSSINHIVPSSSDAAISAKNNHSASLQSLSTVSLNQYNTLAWIDTQGHEPDVFKGAKNLLKSKIPFVTEFWPYGIARAGFSFHSFWKYVKHRRIHILSDNPKPFSKQEALNFFNSAIKVENESYSPHLDLIIM